MHKNKLEIHMNANRKIYTHELFFFLFLNLSLVKVTTEFFPIFIFNSFKKMDFFSEDYTISKYAFTKLRCIGFFQRKSVQVLSLSFMGQKSTFVKKKILFRYKYPKFTGRFKN